MSEVNARANEYLPSVSSPSILAIKITIIREKIEDIDCEENREKAFLIIFCTAFILDNL